MNQPSPPFLVDDQLLNQIDKIISFAFAHTYCPHDPNAIIPGDQPQLTLTTNSGYRIVFSYTQLPDHSLYRDLSISLPDHPYLPNPFVAFSIAKLFHFSGWNGLTLHPPPKDWLFAKDPSHNAIRIAQLI